MKKTIAYLLFLITALTASAQSYHTNTHGSAIDSLLCEVKSPSGNGGNIAVPEAVDLGLSVKWATFNLGATKPEEAGNLYAWGETTPKETYTWNNYKYCVITKSDTLFTKYCTIDSKSYSGSADNKTTLDKSDDAACVNLGGSWRMPTEDELSELRRKCTWTWTSLNGVKGMQVTGTNGNYIFLPAYEEDWKDDPSGDIRSSSLNSTNNKRASWLYYSYWQKDDKIWYWIAMGSREDGIAIRPVCP